MIIRNPTIKNRYGWETFVSLSILQNIQLRGSLHMSSETWLKRSSNAQTLWLENWISGGPIYRWALAPAPHGVPSSFGMSSGRWTVNQVPTSKTCRTLSKAIFVHTFHVWTFSDHSGHIVNHFWEIIRIPKSHHRSAIQLKCEPGQKSYFIDMFLWCSAQGKPNHLKLQRYVWTMLNNLFFGFSISKGPEYRCCWPLFPMGSPTTSACRVGCAPSTWSPHRKLVEQSNNFICLTLSFLNRLRSFLTFPDHFRIILENLDLGKKIMICDPSAKCVSCQKPRFCKQFPLIFSLE